MLQIGDITIHLINDVTAYVDPGGAFGLVPRALYSRYLMPDERNFIPMCHLSLLVQAEGRNIVIDTGFGTKNMKLAARLMSVRPDAMNGLMRGLDALNVTPQDIDLVIDTHLHSDHCGGNTYYVEGGSEPVAAFPNAEYVVQRREYEDARQPNERTRATYIADNFEPLVTSGQMRLLDSDSDLAPGIRGVVTPGHTPGHMSIIFESQGQHGAFICDMASFAVHFERLGWMTAYDVEPLITLETKRKWQRWALDTDATLIFPHDCKRPVGQLKDEEGGKPFLVPLDVPVFGLDVADFNARY
ncbi:MAG: MBL fold metallo-hydrolase [Anaerolineaceae bacterium]|nr:MBL fold metallo-hydrolase [Anaerolineaceae bacterium]